MCFVTNLNPYNYWLTNPDSLVFFLLLTIVPALEAVSFNGRSSCQIRLTYLTVFTPQPIMAVGVLFNFPFNFCFRLTNSGALRFLPSQFTSPASTDQIPLVNYLVHMPPNLCWHDLYCTSSVSPVDHCWTSAVDNHIVVLPIFAHKFCQKWVLMGSGFIFNMPFQTLGLK